MSQANRLRAVYYPFSRCLDETTLKRALLTYDEVVFVDPKTPKVRAGLYSAENHQGFLPDDAAIRMQEDWKRIETEYSSLVNEGCVKLFKPARLLNRKSIDSLITAHLQADMGDESIPQLFSDSPALWSILRSRIPKSSFPYLHHQYTPRVLYEENTRGCFSRDHRGFHALFSDGRPDQDFDSPTGKGAISVAAGEYACVMPYYLGSSIAVSACMAVCSELNATPMTDSTPHHRLLSQRFRRTACLGPNAIPGLKQVENPAKSHLVRLVELRLLDSVLGDDDLRLLSFDDVLEYRSRTKSTREAFRELVLDIAGEIENDVWSVALEKELQRRVKEAHKTLAKEKKELKQTYKSLFHKTAVGVAVSIAPILIASAFPHISVPLSFLYGASAAGFLAEPTKDLVTTWLDRGSAPKNGLTYLFDLKNKASSSD